MAKYAVLVAGLFAGGFGLALLGPPAPPSRAAPEPDFHIIVKGLEGEISVESKVSSCFTDHEAFTLYVQGAGGVPVAEYAFCSSYGRTDAKLVKDGLGKNYVFLEHDEGHGTNAVANYLSIFRVGEDSLHLVMKTELGGGTGPVTRFRYSYWVRLTRTGLQVMFAGRHEGDNTYEWCCTPPDALRTITIDAKYRVIPSPTSSERN